MCCEVIASNALIAAEVLDPKIAWSALSFLGLDRSFF